MGSIRTLMASLAVLLISNINIASAVETEEQWQSLKAPARVQSFPSVFQQPPPKSPDYMVDNTGNKRGVAPIKGQYNGPVWKESGSFEGYMEKLAERKAAGLVPNTTVGEAPLHTNSSTLQSRQGGSFWLSSLGPLGKAPHAGDGYVFYRNVLDYGADNTGATNTEEAINAAIIDGNRCGEECGNTFVLGALIYFPPGTYKVCTPIIQYYLTQFVGDPHDRPIIKGCDEFTGIALVDVDPYVPNMAQPDGTGVNWYINQNQFFRQIRNFVFDLTEMPPATDEHDQELVPTGIHWQVSQACSLQNLLFRMPTAGSSSENLTHVGIFTENGSGGFVSDLEFEGGAIGWRVGSQQYTATSLKFRNCITAVQMVWDWGFNWHKIDIEGGSIAFNISGRGGIDGQGIGSVSIIDSTVSNVPIGVLTNDHATAPPNIVIDNTAFNNVGAIVIVEGGDILLEGGTITVDLWAHGRRYIGGQGERVTGHVENRPRKPEALLDGSGKLFTRLRPQYEDLPASSFLIATENGCSNDGTSDNTAAINTFLQQAAAGGQVAYFPAGIYSVQGTVTFPAGSKIQGSGWSQIQATGSYFDEMENPKVVVRVGEEGDVGTMEIVDMLFTVKGPTAGAIMMEWNIHESSQGAAALWDSHIRVGGGIGTDLDIDTCPKYSHNDACICVSMLLHITKEASGYFENFWAWVADHDNDMSLYWELDSSKSQISLFGARGVLIESQGPVWIYGSGSEHVIYYQYEMLGAKNVYLGHIQTESPYFQPNPVSPSPMENALGVFPGDPNWKDCSKETCEMAWGLRIIDSEGVMVHSAGLYSWFHDYGQSCLESEDCQEKVMEVRGSKDVSIFNIFSKAVEEIGTGNLNESSIHLADGNQQGYTSEISLWFPEDSELDVVYIGTEVYETSTAACNSPCAMVLPPSPLGSTTTITMSPYTTSLEVGRTTTTVIVTPRPITANEMSFYNVNITGGITNGDVLQTVTSMVVEEITVTLTYVNSAGQTTTSERELQLPPWPQITDGPPENWNSTTLPGIPTTTRRTTTGGGAITTLEPWPQDPEPSKTYSTRDPEETEFPIIYVEPILDDIEPQCPFNKCTVDDDNDDDDDDDDADDDDDDGYVWIRVRCDELWFFNFCIDVRGLKVQGWRIRLPKGTIGPGPPPFVPKLPNWYINWPPIRPPWPVITVGPNDVTYPDEDPSCDDNKISVPIELYTRSYGLSVSNGVTVTTTTQTITETAYDTGCPTPEWTSTAACSIRPQRTGAAAMPTRTPGPVVNTTESVANATVTKPRLRARFEEEWEDDGSCPGDEKDVIIYLEDDYDNDDAETLDERLQYDENNFDIRHELFQLTNDPEPLMFIYVWSMPKSLREKIALMPGIASLRTVDKSPTSSFDKHLIKKAKLVEEWMSPDDNASSSSIVQAREPADPIRDDAYADIWWRSQISSYPGEAWDYDGVEDEDDPLALFFEYFHDDTLGENQAIYLLEEDVNRQDPEFTGQQLGFLPRRTDIGSGVFDPDHGTSIAKLIIGRTLGLVPKATMITFERESHLAAKTPVEMILIALLKIVEDMEDNDRDAERRCVVNMSFAMYRSNSLENRLFGREMLKILKYLQNEKNCVLVCSAGNFHSQFPNEVAEDAYPRYFQRNGDLPDMIVAAASGKQAHRSRRSVRWSGNSDEDMVYAPGLRMALPLPGGGSKQLTTGTSLSAPMVAGLVAYLRALDSKWAEDFEKPTNVVKMVKYLTRRVHVVSENEELGGGINIDEDPAVHPRIIWNGHVGRENCLLEYTSDKAKEICDEYVKDIPDDLNDWVPGEVPDACELPGAGAGNRAINGRAICEIGDGNGGGNDDSGGNGFTWTEGAPSPTCTSHCGTLCTGFWCAPYPTGTPPDFEDPANRPPTTTRPPTPPGSTTVPPLPPGSTCASYTPTTVCNGSGGQTVCITSTACATSTVPPLPTLSETGAYSGPGCASYTSTTICNGSGGQSVCITDSICVVTPPPCPAYPTVGTPLCPDDFPLCLKATTKMACARRPTPRTIERGSSPTPAQITPAFTSAPTQTMVNGRFRRDQQDHKLEPEPEPSAAPEMAEPAAHHQDTARAVADAGKLVDESSVSNETGIMANSELLLSTRQSVPIGCGGPETGGCFVVNVCAEGFCARVEQVSCVQAFLHIKMHPIDTEMTLDVYEDGEAVCSWTLECLTVEDFSCFEDLAKDGFDCGGGNKIAAWGNGLSTVDYVSGKTNGRHYMLYLGQVGDTIYYPCRVTFRFWALCIDSDWSASQGLCRSTAALLDVPPRRLPAIEATAAGS